MSFINIHSVTKEYVYLLNNKLFHSDLIFVNLSTLKKAIGNGFHIDDFYGRNRVSVFYIDDGELYLVMKMEKY